MAITVILLVLAYGIFQVFVRRAFQNYMRGGYDRTDPGRAARKSFMQYEKGLPGKRPDSVRKKVRYSPYHDTYVPAKPWLDRVRNTISGKDR